MHRILCQELLAEEVALTNARPVRARLVGDVELDGLIALVPVAYDGRSYLLALTGRNYNAVALSVAIRDPAGGDASVDGWPSNLCGGVHPITGRPFCCMRGVAEYYLHPSHLNERWDQHRDTHRLYVLLGQLLNKIGVPT